MFLEAVIRRLKATGRNNYDLSPSRMLWLLALSGMLDVGRVSFGFEDWRSLAIA
jgi:hypothetical protein